MAQDNLVVCYNGIQRIYRNAVVRFLRSRMTETFAEEAVEKLQAPFQKEWELVKANAMALRTSGELGNSVADDFDFLSVNHFFNLFDAYYETLSSDISSGSDADKKRQKQALLGWIKQIKSQRDPLSHPTEEDFNREDSYVLLDCARRVLLRLGLSDAAGEIKALMDTLFERGFLSTNEDAQRQPLDDRLPPRNSIVVQFVGRQKELAELREWFSDPVARRWALAGEGGKGKSAVAFSFAVEVKVQAPPPFQTVLWLSAKRRQFVEGSTISIPRPDFFDMDTALSCVLTHYGWLEETESPLESKRQRVLQLLEEFPALIVVDDIDSLDSENEDVIEFFSLQVPATSSKVLFTSRRPIFGLGGATTHIGGLSDEDAAAFIFSRCEIMELDPAVFDKNLIKRIIKATDSSPLYIEDLMRLTATVNSAPEAVRVWEGKGGSDARRYALGREWDLLTPDARRVLVGACVCPGAVPFTLIEEVTGCSAQRVTTALQELQRLFLVPKPKLIEGEQRFEVNVNTRALVRECYGSSQEYRKIQDAYRTISKGVPEAARGDVGASIRQALFLSRALKSKEAEETLSKALARKPNNPDLLAVLGRVYQEWKPPRVTDARESFRRACQLKCKRPQMYEHWCSMELEGREWSKAVDAAERGLKLLPKNRTLLFLAGYARHRLGRDLQQGIHEDRAAEHFTEARMLLEAALRLPREANTGEHLDVRIYRALVRTCEMENDSQEVRRYCRMWRRAHPNDPEAASEWDRLCKKFNFTDR